MRGRIHVTPYSGNDLPPKADEALKASRRGYATEAQSFEAMETQDNLEKLVAAGMKSDEEFHREFNRLHPLNPPPTS